MKYSNRKIEWSTSSRNFATTNNLSIFERHFSVYFNNFNNYLVAFTRTRTNDLCVDPHSGLLLGSGHGHDGVPLLLTVQDLPQRRTQLPASDDGLVEVVVIVVHGILDELVLQQDTALVACEDD